MIWTFREALRGCDSAGKPAIDAAAVGWTQSELKRNRITAADLVGRVHRTSPSGEGRFFEWAGSTRVGF
jgi:hypothetical protein